MLEKNTSHFPPNYTNNTGLLALKLAHSGFKILRNVYLALFVDIFAQKLRILAVEVGPFHRCGTFSIDDGKKSIRL